MTGIQFTPLFGGDTTKAEALLGDALELHESNKFQEADKIYQELVRQFPCWAPGLWNYARMLHSFPHIPDAIHKAAQMYSATLKADGDFHELKAEAYNGLGTILLSWGENKLAAGCFEHAMALNPKHPYAPVNIGVAHRMAGNLVSAENAQRVILLADPNQPEAHLETAFIRMAMGDLLGGFVEYEWRWKCPNFISARMDHITQAPKWNGEDLTGKSIMLPYEQGFGDAIMFIRYAKMIKDRHPSATIRTWVTPELVPIIKLAHGVDEVFNSHEPVPDTFDYYCPMLSLPRIFKTTLETIPAEIPYFNLGGAQLPNVSRECVEPARLPHNTSGIHMNAPGASAGQNNHGSAKPFVIGFVWAGRKEHAGDRWRSMDVDLFKPLFDVPGIEWRSFQFGDRRGDADKFLHVKRTSEKFRDFVDTAKALTELDLLISVDTSVIHLAGALGVRTWALIPYSPDWRWMLSGDTTPWYPAMRLFRQDKRGDWVSVIERVRKELCTYALASS